MKFESVLMRQTVAKGTVWQSGRVSLEQSVHIPYGGPALQSNQRYAWQVRVWGQYSSETIGLE